MPAREGLGDADPFAGAGLDVTLCTDAAVAHLLAEESVEVVLVGADAVLPDGSVVNKVGTRAAASAAAREDISVLRRRRDRQGGPGLEVKQRRRFQRRHLRGERSDSRFEPYIWHFLSNLN